MVASCQCIGLHVPPPRIAVGNEFHTFVTHVRIARKPKTGYVTKEKLTQGNNCAYPEYFCAEVDRTRTLRWAVSAQCFKGKVRVNFAAHWGANGAAGVSYCS